MDIHFQVVDILRGRQGRAVMDHGQHYMCKHNVTDGQKRATENLKTNALLITEPMELWVELTINKQILFNS